MDNLPYLTAALLCERVLQEKDGTLSAFRIVDQIEFELQTDTPEIKKLDIKPALQLNILIAIKAGPAKGRVTLNIDSTRPSGMRKHLIEFPLELKGGEEGANFIINLVQGTDEEGLHWFEVKIDDTLLTKIPLMLVRKPTQLVSSGEMVAPPDKN